MKKITVLAAVVMIILSQFSFAASAVYWCPYTTVYASAWNYQSVYDAEAKARSNVFRGGGTNPSKVVSTSSAGWGCVMFGSNSYGSSQIVSMVGAASESEARDRCYTTLRYSGYIYDVEWDTFEDTAY